MRAEIERLKKSNEDCGELLKSFASGQNLDAFQTVIQGSMDGNTSHKDYHLKDIEEDVDSRPALLQHDISPREQVDLSCFDELHSWRSCHPRINERNPSKISEQSTILSLPPLPLDAYISHSHTDTWTRTGWTMAHIRHLFDTILTWDYLPFSLLCKDQFLQDYQNGSNRFCSSALVHAVLALASRLINENEDDFRLLPSGWFGSKFFLNDAEALLQSSGPLNSLPDIQALGILSCYQIRCGQEAKAHELAEACLVSITELCQREPLVSKEEEQYSRARATTYCGAVSLVRYAINNPLRLY